MCASKMLSRTPSWNFCTRSQLGSPQSSRQAPPPKIHSQSIVKGYNPWFLTGKLIVGVLAEFGKEADFMICGMGDEPTSFDCNNAFVRDVMGTLAKLKSGSQGLHGMGEEIVFKLDIILHTQPCKQIAFAVLFSYLLILPGINNGPFN
jgi:hypothetical protein